MGEGVLLQAIKRVLELGCGSGIVAGAIALLGHTVVAVDIVDVCVANARRVAARVSHGELIVVQADFYDRSYALTGKTA